RKLDRASAAALTALGFTLVGSAMMFFSGGDGLTTYGEGVESSSEVVVLSDEPAGFDEWSVGADCFTGGDPRVSVIRNAVNSTAMGNAAASGAKRMARRIRSGHGEYGLPGSFAGSVSAPMAKASVASTLASGTRIVMLNSFSRYFSAYEESLSSLAAMLTRTFTRSRSMPRITKQSPAVARKLTASSTRITCSSEHRSRSSMKMTSPAPVRDCRARHVS